jgi:hypothetical protein
MKILTYCSVVVLVSLLSFPLTAEAFSRGADNTPVVQHQVQAPRDGKTGTQNISPQAVPEPPVLLLMGIGIGLFAIFLIIKRFREHAASREKAM